MESTTKEIVTLQDDSVKFSIRTLWLQGKSIKDIQAELGIPMGTWDSAFWRNTHGFRDFFFEIKKEKMLLQAERVSDKIMNMEAVETAKMLAIQQKEAEFIRETQGKDMGYSKRIETIGLNINKTEPLDDEQKEKLNKLLKKSGSSLQVDKNVDVLPQTGSTQP